MTCDEIEIEGRAHVKCLFTERDVKFAPCECGHDP